MVAAPSPTVASPEASAADTGREDAEQYIGLQNAMMSSREHMSAEAEGYRIERSLIDSWLLRGIFDRPVAHHHDPRCDCSINSSKVSYQPPPLWRESVSNFIKIPRVCVKYDEVHRPAQCCRIAVLRRRSSPHLAHVNTQHTTSSALL